MYNLLVSGAGWAEARDSLLASRAFEYTDDHLIERFKPNGQLDFSSLTALPTLFLEESSASGDEVARLGTITRARVSGRDLLLEYVFDVEIPPLTNNRLNEFATDLDIERFEFSRTHWAVKDVDLYKTLYRNLQPRRRQPEVFQIADPERIDPDQVSAMMPFNSGFDSVYTTIEEAAKSVGFRCNRADNIWENPAIIQDVVSLIDRSAIVICDCTGRNLNVFYEIGIAHTLGREVILITQSRDDIPFDLQHLRHVMYLNNGEGRDELRECLKRRMADLM